MLVRSVPVKSRNRLAHDVLKERIKKEKKKKKKKKREKKKREKELLLSHMPALFMTSLIQTAGRKVTALTNFVTILLRLWNVD